LNVINKSKDVSLRRRFKIFAGVLVIFILACAGFGYQRLSTTESNIETNLVNRHNVLETTHILRASLLDIFKAIDSFLLEPAQPEYWDDIERALDKSLLLSKQFAISQSLVEENDKNDFRLLYETLGVFKNNIDELIKVRLDPSRQYPSLGVGFDVMGPNRNNVNNAFGLAINSLRGEEALNDRPEVLDIFIQGRHIWTQMLSNFRLYLANRMGSFNEASLPTQEAGIKTLYGEYKDVLKKLKPLVESGEVGFETSEAYGLLLVSAENWFVGFQKVKYIHATSEWRIDAKIMKEKIVPNIELASDLLNTIHNRLIKASEQDISAISEVASLQTLVLWIVAGIAILFVVSLFIAVEKSILIPVGMIAAALKREALGKENIELPNFYSNETKDLIDAFSEMSRQIHLRQTELEHRALHDSLTSLPNRTLLFDHIRHDISVAKRDNTQLSLLMIDLDLFKEVNDTFGHAVGDQLLIEMGKRLKLILREVDIVARMGGDEFAVLLPGVGATDVSKIANKIFKASQLPYNINELELVVAASIGVAIYPEHGHDEKELLQHADVAMYVAKQNKLGYSIYDPDQDEYSIVRFSMIAALRDAIKNNEITLYFQPKLDLRSSKVLSVEALLRWQHPEYGFVSPETIVNLAEQTGLIKQLSYWVAENAMIQLTEWRKRKIDISISINISAHNLKDEGFVAGVKTLVEKHNVTCEKLTLEITENAMMEDPLLAVSTLKEFNDMDFNISVDDYGTGFSSLSYLSKLPVDELKIDKSFVMDMDKVANNEMIVRSTIELAHNLGLRVVAEGIESKLVWNMLRSYGCDQGQGYFMSKPVPAAEFENWLIQQEKAAS